jgi:spermidine synthase/predicted MFS family arabinose efflux permease
MPDRLADAAPAPADGVRTWRAGLDRPSRFVVVFMTGIATMGLQICATRLLAPVVGGSAIVFATVIGLSLCAMGAGYALGGRRADRRPDGRALGRLLLVTAALIAAIPLAAPPVLERSDLGFSGTVSSVLVASAVAYLLLFAAPAMLLGMSLPYVARLGSGPMRNIGGTAGRLYAVSTIGSIIGTLASALVLLQWIGTRQTLWSIAALALAGGIVALSRGSREQHDVFDHESTESHRATPTEPEDRAPAVLPFRLAALVIFVEGVAMMATEMSAARLLASFFGAGTIVWANLIAVVMAGIALGAWAGGRLAERRNSARLVTSILGASGLTVLIVPFVARSVMQASSATADSGLLASFGASLVILVFPVFLLGMLPPLVIGLASTSRAHAGRSVGTLYALSTAGALVGTFASVLVLIPGIGTAPTFVATAALLVGTGMYVRPPRTWALVAFALLMLLAVSLASSESTGRVPEDGTVLFAGESRYQHVQVFEREDGLRELRLNEGNATHSVWAPNSVFAFGIWDTFLLLPALTGGDDQNSPRVALLGNAAGSSARSYAAAWPEAEFTGVEIDPLVTKVGREYFQLGSSGERIVAADARPFLARARERWDVIHVDAYRQPHIPFYLTTREFFETAKSRLGPGGVISINVAGTASDGGVHEAIAATMREEFPLVLRYRPEGIDNELLVGFSEPGLTRAAVQARTEAGIVEPMRRLTQANENPQYIERVFSGFATQALPVKRDPSRVLTDDKAPVEWLIDRDMSERGDCFICLGV